MNYTRSAIEQREFERIFDTSTQTLRNKLGISDPKTLEQVERQVTRRAAQSPLPSTGQAMTYDGFKAIHAHLFGDIYAWAGQERKYTTGRGPAPFAPPKQISSWMEKQFTALRKEGFLQGLPKGEFAKRTAHYVNEINAVHPFVDGNGRAQRMWLRVLADRNGLEFRLGSKDREVWNKASMIGFNSTNKPMADLITANLRERGKSQSQEKTSLQRKAGRAAKNYREQAEPDKNPERER